MPFLSSSVSDQIKVSDMYQEWQRAQDCTNLQANGFPCHSLIDIVRRHESPTPRGNRKGPDDTCTYSGLCCRRGALTWIFCNEQLAHLFFAPKRDIIFIILQSWYACPLLQWETPLSFKDFPLYRHLWNKFVTKGNQCLCLQDVQSLRDYLADLRFMENCHPTRRS